MLLLSLQYCAIFHQIIYIYCCLSFVCVCVCVPGINSAIVRGICKVIGTTLTKYKDPVSQNLVRSLITSLVQQHPDLTVEHLNTVLKALLAKDLATNSLKTSQAAVIALGWSIIVAGNACTSGSDTIKTELPKLVANQAELYQLALASPNAKVAEKATQILTQFWQQHKGTDELYFKHLIGAESSSSVIIFLSTILSYRFDQDDGNVTLLHEHKAALLEHFIKGLVSVKVKPREQFIPACRVLLTSISHAEFKASVQSALQRAMLRSPEIVLQAVGAIVQQLQIDVSDFAEELGKPLIQNLYTKDDVARSEAVYSLTEIAKRCSSARVVEALLKQIFAVLNGSDGKITVTEYRINVLQVSDDEMYLVTLYLHVYILAPTHRELAIWPTTQCRALNPNNCSRPPSPICSPRPSKRKSTRK